MYYANIKETDIANGTGVRVSLFVSGCTHHCKNCFNQVAWDFKYGKPFTDEVKNYILKKIEPSYISGLTLLGGEPLEPINQRGLIELLRDFKCKFGNNKTIWCYSGYLFDKELLSESRARCEVTDEFLSYIDVLVDGEFVDELKNLTLKFRGSSNQRIIDVPKSLKNKNVVLLDL